MVTIKDGCGCSPCDCDWKQKLKEAYSRASVSVNKVGDFDGAIYYPDGSGFVKLPIPRLSEIQLIHTNKDDIDQLKVEDIRLQANIDAEKTARIAKDENLDSDIARIDATDARQSELIQDNADRINSTYNDLVATEATVATHDSEIITLKANNQALAKSLVSDVIMTDGTTAGSVQVSIEREDGALITSANYKWGRDIGVRLEAGTQAGYIKTVISLSDGTELESNEYKIVEVLESDVYVTAITLVPDMTAGTIGGNISYSNGTTQTINSVSVPTAPGVTSAIETLQGRVTAVEQKNTTQDADITSLKSRVQAIEDTPGVGQFAAGKLGTIAGSTTDGRIKAEDDGTGSVNGWTDLKGRVNTAEGQIVTAQGDISDLDRRVGAHSTEISGLQSSKVNVAQGAANAGKALVVGADGNVVTSSIKASFPLSVCNIKLDNYMTYNTSGTANVYTASSVLKNVGDRENYPTVDYDCAYFAIAQGVAVSGNVITTLTFTMPSSLNTLIPMFNEIFDKLNVDISNLPDHKYRIELIGCSGTKVTSNYTFYLMISNGVITSVSIDGSPGSITFPGSSSTKYCGIGIKNIYPTS